jgi:hypothetical protein
MYHCAQMGVTRMRESGSERPREAAAVPFHSSELDEAAYRLDFDSPEQKLHMTSPKASRG